MARIHHRTRGRGKRAKRALKTSVALTGARWAWNRRRRGAERSKQVSAVRRGARLLTWGAAGAVLGVGAAMMSEHGHPRRLRGKVVLITGGSRGLGLQLAREFGAQGALVVVCGRGRESLDHAVSELTERGVDAHGVVCDVTDPEQIAALLEEVDDRYGRLDVLVNSAGIMRVGPWEALTEEHFVQAMDVIFWGPLRLSRQALGRLRERQGTIVNITSIGAYLSVPHLTPYSCAKHAQAGLSEGLAAETAGTGVSVTTVAPGLMRTGSHRGVVFNGAPEREYAWFALLAGLPLLSVNAERAAHRIVGAVARGRSFLVLTPVARAGMAVHGLAPGLIQESMRLMGRLLPNTPESPEERSGSEAARGPLGRAVGVVATLNERAYEQLNQVPHTRQSRRAARSEG
ncbi:SDR family NAD(P)-dependent oxidoreductase [Nocardiopsis alkaliphila]|uniref:SDR family NAD(P)-dependent oxidoreductase n=1 Tax=Nocardiopsis alkaliphila TaxID=225762 RepID=UPI00034505E9|nr:SDR family oxidoreductase [Nocardiopsis alkaliphila]